MTDHERRIWAADTRWIAEQIDDTPADAFHPDEVAHLRPIFRTDGD